MSNTSVYIVAAQRTQIGKKNGGLKNFLAHDLGSHVIKSLIKKIDLEPVSYTHLTLPTKA